MAKVIDTYINEHGETINVYESGAEYNADKKHLVKPAKDGMITVDNAKPMQARAIAKKHEIAMRALNREVSDKSLIDEFGEYAWMAESFINQQRIATEPTAGKAAVLAHESNIRNSGHDEKMQQTNDDRQLSPLELAMASLIEAVTSKVRQSGVDVIDAETSDE